MEKMTPSYTAQFNADGLIISVKSTTEYQELNVKYNRLLGEFLGYLEGVLFWDVDKELVKRLEDKIKELKKL